MATNPSTLTEDAERLLEQMRQVPPREPGEALRPCDEARILVLAEQGWTQERIAAEVGCHQSTVSRTIAEYDDTRPLARKYLNARALDMARRFVEKARPADVLEMMGRLNVIPRPNDRGDVQVPPTLSRAFPGTETAYGWSFLRLSNAGLAENSSLGWNISVARNLAPWLGIVGDFGGHYYTQVFGVDEIDVMQHTFMAGPRFALRESALAVPYGQFLVGLARSDLRFLGFHESSHEFAIQPGGGIDVGSQNLAARFEVAWRKLFDEEDPPTGFRIVVGAVVRSGGTRTR